MPAYADLIITDAHIHTVDDDRSVAEAVAISDGRIVRVGDMTSVERLADVETTIIPCDGRVVLPGFIDAHTHMESTGRHLVHADLSEATTREEAIDLLTRGDIGHEWIFGFGYDESTWPEGELLRRDDLDEVSTERPVVAYRVDMHTASINSVALERVGDTLPEDDIELDEGEPTGLITEDAVGVVSEQTADASPTLTLLEAATAHALSLGVTCVHDMVRHSDAPRVYRALDIKDELDLRIRLNYWSNHLDAVDELGLQTNHGSDRVEVGAIKTFTDGAIGGRTAKVTEAYVDGEGTGTWVVDPDELEALVKRVDDAGHQLTIHAIGDEAIEVTLDKLESTDSPGRSRHRVEHVELASDEQIQRFTESGIIASVQPNFHQWSGEGGLYDRRLGEARSRGSNRFRTMADAGVNLAFGSDSMPIGPLYGIHCAVNARDPSQRLTVDEAIEAYTLGSAYAGFAEDDLGSIEPGKLADLVILEESPWEVPNAIAEIEVWKTIVGGEVVYRSS